MSCLIIPLHFFSGPPLPLPTSSIAIPSQFLASVSAHLFTCPNLPCLLHLVCHICHSHLITYYFIPNHICPSMPTRPCEHPHLNYIRELHPIQQFERIMTRKLKYSVRVNLCGTFPFQDLPKTLIHFHFYKTFKI